MDWVKLSWTDGGDVNYFNNNGYFIIDLSNIEFNDADILDNAYKTIEEIIKNNPPPYRLFLSGGIDSQAMVYVWLKSGVPFEAHTFIYDRVMNLHDISLLWEYVKEFQIPITHHHISHFKFLEDDLRLYSKTYSCNSPQITMHMKMLDTFKDGTSILSGNPIYSDDSFYNYTILGLERYRHITQKNVVPFFWTHTSYLTGSWYFKSLLSDRYLKSQGIRLEGHDMKIYLYQEAGIPIGITQKKSGFEKYKIYFDNFKLDPWTRTKRILNKTNRSKRNYDILFRYSLMDENPCSGKKNIIGLNYNDKIFDRF